MAATNPSSSNRTDLDVVLALTKRLARAGPHVRQDLIMGVILEAAGVTFGVIGPFALKALIDAFTEGTATSVYTVAWAGMFVLAWALGGVLSTWRLVYSTRVFDTVTAQLAADALAGELPRVASAKDGDSGRTLGLIERLPYSLLVVVDGLIWRSGPLCLQIVASLWVIAGVIPLHYAAGLLLVLGVYTWLSWRGAVRHRAFAEVANLAAASVSQTLGDVLRNARRIVLNGMLGPEIKGVEAQVGEKARANRRMMGALVVTALQQYGWLGLGLVALLIAASGDVLAKRMSVGDFIMLETYALRLALPLSGIGFLLSQSAAAIANIRDVMALAVEAFPLRRAPPVPQGAAAISLDAVSYRYPATTSGIENVSLDLPAGAFAVIVGPNGSGKSTLAQTLAGLFVPTQGTVRIAGQDLGAVAADSRYRWVLYVPQFISFLNRSLRDNALYPPTRTTEADLTSLLAQWRFYEAGRAIDLNAPVGELGERLSGGQIQKLELARIAGVDVPVLVLDESTSALDPASEATVLDDLRRRFAGRTTLVMVTHHLSLVEKADLVIYMKAGNLAAMGQHSLLLNLADYRDLFGR